MRIFIAFALFVCFVALNSCDRTDSSIKRHMRFIQNPENGLVQKAMTKNYKYILRYLPKEYMALKELGAHFDKEKYNEYLKNYEAHHYFSLQIQPVQTGKSLAKVIEQGSGVENYPAVIQAIHFELQQDFKLIIGQDTLPCVLYHAEPPNLDYTGIQILTVFAMDENFEDVTKDLKFQFQDHHLTQKTLSFLFKANDLKKIPPIKS